MLDRAQCSSLSFVRQRRPLGRVVYYERLLCPKRATGANVGEQN